MFHGLRVEVAADDSELQANLRFDFAKLIKEFEGPAEVRFEAVVCSPPFDRVPPVEAASQTETFVCYDAGGFRYVDYYGRALAVHDRRGETVEIFANDRTFLYEKFYLAILSRTGELLDRRGIHRVHALGLLTERGAALLLLPMHGGKSTLGLALVSASDVKLLSDDSPLINRAGEVLDFPLRMGVRRGDEPQGLLEQYQRNLVREGREPKTLIHLDALGESLAPSGAYPPAVLIAGKWTAAPEPNLIRVSRFRGFASLLRDCVIGLGLPQVVEFFLQSTWSDLFAKSRLVFSRSRASWNLARRSQCYTLLLCRSRERNVELIRRALEG